ARSEIVELSRNLGAEAVMRLRRGRRDQPDRDSPDRLVRRCPESRTADRDRGDEKPRAQQPRAHDRPPSANRLGRRYPGAEGERCGAGGAVKVAATWAGICDAAILQV